MYVEKISLQIFIFLQTSSLYVSGHKALREKKHFQGVGRSTLVLGAQLGDQTTHISAGCICLQPLKDQVSDLFDLRQGN